MLDEGYIHIVCQFPLLLLTHKVRYIKNAGCACNTTIKQTCANMATQYRRVKQKFIFWYCYDHKWTYNYLDLWLCSTKYWVLSTIFGRMYESIFKASSKTSTSNLMDELSRNRFRLLLSKFEHLQDLQCTFKCRILLAFVNIYKAFCTVSRKWAKQMQVWQRAYSFNYHK